MQVRDERCPVNKGSLEKRIEDRDEIADLLVLSELLVTDGQGWGGRYVNVCMWIQYVCGW